MIPRAQASINLLFAGYPSETIGHFLQQISTQLLDYTMLHLETALIDPSTSSKSQTRLRGALLQTSIAGRLGIALLTSPFHIFGLLQRLGALDDALALPGSVWLLPWRMTSPLIWAWSSGPSTLGVTDQILNMALSPVSLLMTTMLMRAWRAEYVERTGVLRWLVAPCPSMEGRDASREDRMSLAGRARLRSLRFIGWSADQPRGTIDTHALLDDLGATQDEVTRFVERDDAEHDTTLQSSETDNTMDIRDVTRRKYNTTTLSMLPATFLARQVEDLSTSILLLPLTTLLARSTLTCWRVLDASSAVPVWKVILFGHRGRGPSSFWRTASKVGLCICADAAVRTVLWAGTCVGVGLWCSWRNGMLSKSGFGNEVDDAGDDGADDDGDAGADDDEDAVDDGVEEAATM